MLESPPVLVMHDKEVRISQHYCHSIPYQWDGSLFYDSDSLSQGKDKVVGDQVVSTNNFILQVLSYLGGTSFII